MTRLAKKTVMSSQHLSALTLEEWAGSQNLNLTLVFTDIVDSTLIGKKLGDRRWIDDLFLHFSQARSLTNFVDCFVVKVIGDSLMMAFRTSWTSRVSAKTPFTLRSFQAAGKRFASTQKREHSYSVSFGPLDPLSPNCKMSKLLLRTSR